MRALSPPNAYARRSSLSATLSCAILSTIWGLSACDDEPAPSPAGAEAGQSAGQSAGQGGDLGAGAEAGAGGSAGASPLAGAEPAQRCVVGEGYQSGRPAFREQTIEVGLEGVMGTLMSVGDLNGDGWPDLIVRRGGVKSDVLDLEPPKRHTWVLMNREGRFEDNTEASGFLATRGSYPRTVGRPNWVVVLGDVDNDGDLDAYSGIDMRNPPSVEVEGEPSFVVDQERSELLLNDGQGHFELTYLQDPLRRVGAEDVPSGAAFVDVDRDGWLDLWISQGGLGAPLQDRLFKNQGRGDFEDVTATLGLSSRPWEELSDLNEGLAHTTAWSAAACDLNGDGAPELLAASYGRAPNHLWLASGQGAALSYENHSVASGYAYDENQGWEDNQFARCYCQANPNAAGCSGVPAPLINCSSPNWRHSNDREPFRLGGNSGATLCEDFDGDGDLDLYTTEIKHWWAGEGSDGSELLINDGQARFTRPGRQALGLSIEHAGTSWDEGHITAAAFDFDNDGALDIYLGATDYAGNRGRLYHNLSGGELGPRFEELSLEDGIAHNRSHGVVSGDFDRDGDLDVIVGHSRMRCGDDEVTGCYQTMQIRYFENLLGSERAWVQLDLEGGAGSNRDAVGAWVELSVPATETRPARVITRYIKEGYGHFGQQSERVLHIGLDDACSAEVRVLWPNAERAEQRFSVSAGARYKVKQGEEPQRLD